jgi:hypothetical protein
MKEREKMEFEISCGVHVEAMVQHSSTWRRIIRCFIAKRHERLHQHQPKKDTTDRFFLKPFVLVHPPSTTAH